MNNLKTRFSKVLWKQKPLRLSSMFNDAWYNNIGNFFFFRFVFPSLSSERFNCGAVFITSTFHGLLYRANQILSFFNIMIDEFFWSHSLYVFDTSSKSAERFPFSVDQYHTLLWLNYEGFERRNFRPICPSTMQINRFTKYTI